MTKTVDLENVSGSNPQIEQIVSSFLESESEQVDDMDMREVPNKNIFQTMALDKIAKRK